MGGDRGPLLRLLATGREDRLLHVHRSPARTGAPAPWPGWVPDPLRRAVEATGVRTLWTHQATVAELARDGRHVIVSTGTASGKSLAYLLPTLAAVLEGTAAPDARGATVLYLAPTKALAHDQLQAVDGLALPGVRAATYDGDTPDEERAWVRSHAQLVLTNPDLVHRSLLPGHRSWSTFLRSLSFVVVDECHAYRGVFGSHVANVLRRLTRVAARYGSRPTYVLASATVGEPAVTASALVGEPVVAVTEDGSPHGATDFALWEPPLSDGGGEHGAPSRRTAIAETADLLADLVGSGVRCLAFTRSRRGAEAVAMLARDRLGGDTASRVAAYRGGYLPEERRSLERSLRDGGLLGLSATSALELGIDVSGLDVVLLAGWPGARSSMWQRSGRAGREGQDALAVLVARDDPLDTYLVHHPGAVFGPPVEASVSDPTNPYVLAPHLAAAAAELPLTEADLPAFGPGSRAVVDTLVGQGLLRVRPGGWYWTRQERAADLADLRGIGGGPVRVVEQGTGRLLGTVDPGAAHASLHVGAVYVHQGVTYVVDELDLEAAAAHAHREDVTYTTSARDVTDIAIVAETSCRRWGPDARVVLGTVDVKAQVVSFLRRDQLTGEVLGEEPLDLPVRELRTSAVWWTLAPPAVDRVLDEADVPGGVHAAEHASIGLLPLVATCDRWDIGGVSTARHAGTGSCTSFVYDGYPGGAGFAQRGFRAAATWLGATRDAIAACECPDGCPSCVQSPKCGNGNTPLDKAAGLRLLTTLLADPDLDSSSDGSPDHDGS